MGTQPAWPSEIRLASDRRSLTIRWDDGTDQVLTAEYLRVESPSAEVQGHGPSEKKTVPGKANVEILQVEPVGHYAVRLVFDDMHSTGIYAWDYLRELAQRHDEKWSAYMADLAARGLSREPGRAAPRKGGV